MVPCSPSMFERTRRYSVAMELDDSFEVGQKYHQNTQNRTLRFSLPMDETTILHQDEEEKDQAQGEANTTRRFSIGQLMDLTQPLQWDPSPPHLQSSSSSPNSSEMTLAHTELLLSALVSPPNSASITLDATNHLSIDMETTQACCASPVTSPHQDSHSRARVTDSYPGETSNQTMMQVVAGIPFLYGSLKRVAQLLLHRS